MALELQQAALLGAGQEGFVAAFVRRKNGMFMRERQLAATLLT